MNPTDEGKRLSSFVSAIRSFHNNLSEMLVATAELVGKSGWEAAGDATCWMDTSIGYFNPEKWRPREVFRFFKSEARPHALACFCVLLEKRTDEKEQKEFLEPLATVVWFDFGDKKPGTQGSNWKLWLSRWYSYSPAAQLGEWMTNEVADLPPEEVNKHDYQWSSVRGMAIPLAELTSAEALKQRLLDPMLQDIDQRSKGRVAE